VSEAMDRARAILAYLENEVDAMVEMLVDLASHESPSDVPDSQAGVQDQLTNFLKEMDFKIRHVPGRETGDYPSNCWLVIRTRFGRSGLRIPCQLW